MQTDPTQQDKLALAGRFEEVSEVRLWGFASSLGGLRPFQSGEIETCGLRSS
jgi:hypothetical protein